MFPIYPQQSSLATQNLQLLINLTKRYAGGLQQLTELNVQTVKTVLEESASIMKARESAKPGEFLIWQSTLFAELPEKAAAYSRHFLSIIRATETDILNETCSHYEQYGISMKGVLESAVAQGQSALQEPTARLIDITAASTNAVKKTGGIVLDASGEIAQNTFGASALSADDAQETSDVVLRSAKAGFAR